jgi:hypothetical protein
MTTNHTETLAADRKEAVHAFHRLHQTLASVVADPFRADALKALETAAYEANTKMQAAGLLDLPQHQVMAMVRAEFPGFGPTGGLAPGGRAMPRQPAEFQLTRDNVTWLFEEIELSKFHYRANPEAKRGVEIDGLTVLERGERHVAYFGDWITRDAQGHHHIRPA